ncbi:MULTISPECIES: hypothetical protein [Streptomycetaceae]|uniref:hypothetical protein n=1 Tax=unclassified Streptomyces TaxID=2593676 RepID=UPI0033852D5A
MSAAQAARRRAGTAAPGRRGVRETMEILGLRAVLLAYWGTSSLLARGRAKPRAVCGESVRRTP